ncbi:MAG: hypothetical protein H7A27_08260 [Spirochaetaceae bacterium]|nr:hypothetical protein [Spirochaetaceae bacterium]
MPHVIHYEDDIFIIDAMVRTLCDASRLEPDPDVLGDAMLSIAKLADASLRRARDLVLMNEHQVDRPESLRLLARTTRSFADSVTTLLRPDAPLGRHLASSADELARMASAQRAAASELADALRQATGEDASPEDHVSGDELSELLRL